MSHFDHTSICNIAKSLKGAFPEQSVAEVERTIFEIVYGGLIGYVWYADDPATPDVTWDHHKVHLKYPAGWDPWLSYPDFNLPREQDSWVEYPCRIAETLCLLTSWREPRFRPIIVGRSKQEGTRMFVTDATASWLAQDIRRLPRSRRRKERENIVAALCSPTTLCGDSGIRFTHDETGITGSLRLEMRPLFVDFDQREAYFPATFTLDTDRPLNAIKTDQRGKLLRYLWDCIRPEIKARGGFSWESDDGGLITPAQEGQVGDATSNAPPEPGSLRVTVDLPGNRVESPKVECRDGLLTITASLVDRDAGASECELAQDTPVAPAGSPVDVHPVDVPAPCTDGWLTVTACAEFLVEELCTDLRRARSLVSKYAGLDAFESIGTYSSRRIEPASFASWRLKTVRDYTKADEHYERTGKRLRKGRRR